MADTRVTDRPEDLVDESPLRPEAIDHTDDNGRMPAAAAVSDSAVSGTGPTEAVAGIGWRNDGEASAGADLGPASGEVGGGEDSEASQRLPAAETEMVSLAVTPAETKPTGMSYEEPSPVAELADVEPEMVVEDEAIVASEIAQTEPAAAELPTYPQPVALAEASVVGRPDAPGEVRREPPAGTAALSRPASVASPTPAARVARPSFGASFLLVLLGGILGAAAALLVVYLANGTLVFASRSNMIAVTDRLNVAVLEADTLSANLDVLTTRMGTAEARFDEVTAGLTGVRSDLDAMGVRVAEVEGMKGQLERTVSQVGQLSSDMDGLRTSVAEVRASADRFDRFLTDLRALLNQTSTE